MLRRYVPKGVSIENFSDEDILWAADALNSLPRRNLGYCTPEELFETFLVNSLRSLSGCESSNFD